MVYIQRGRHQEGRLWSRTEGHRCDRGDGEWCIYKEGDIKRGGCGAEQKDIDVIGETESGVYTKRGTSRGEVVERSGGTEKAMKRGIGRRSPHSLPLPSP